MRREKVSAGQKSTPGRFLYRDGKGVKYDKGISSMSCQQCDSVDGSLGGVNYRAPNLITFIFVSCATFFSVWLWQKTGWQTRR